VDIPQIDLDEMERRRAEGAFLLDVRTYEEYETAHVPGAVLVPMREIPDRVDELPAGTPLVVICQTGARSQRVCEFLGEDGWDVANVAGGTADWVDSGRPVATGSDPG
jgi:rhodanese-related sulfurtransferase